MSKQATTRGERPGRPPTVFHGDSAGLAAGARVSLVADEVAHLRSLRLRPESPVELTDGRGNRWAARLDTVDRRSADVVVGEALDVVAPPPFDLWVPVGNRDRSLWLVEKAVEIGVSGIRFVEFERSRSVADAGRSSGFFERANRRALSALKQSRGSTLPRILGPTDLMGALDELVHASVRQSRWVHSPGGRPIHSLAVECDLSSGLILLTGPEGGLRNAEERACRDQGFVPSSLGPRTLRFETAAVVGLAVAAGALDCRAWQANPAGVTRQAEA